MDVIDAYALDGDACALLAQVIPLLLLTSAFSRAGILGPKGPRFPAWVLVWLSVISELLLLVGATVDKPTAFGILIAPLVWFNVTCLLVAVGVQIATQHWETD